MPEPARPVLCGDPLSLADVVRVARGEAEAGLGERGRAALSRARGVVDRFLAEGAGATYGINTGFGALAEVRIPPADLAELQLRLLRSHAVGVGAPLSREATRAMILLRAHVLCLGYSGVRPVVVERLLDLLRAGVHPVIPEKGSVGASGDLAPLAHLALVLVGEGEAEVGGEVVPGAEALLRAGIEPLVLEAKEGLSLINGTQGMLAVGGLALHRARILVETADVTGAMSLEGMKGSLRPFEDAVVRARPHPGALASAAHLRALLADSEINRSHADCAEVQDAYSLRCMPQVHGSARDLLGFAEGVVATELDSATDNPLVLPDGRILSGGNFHGQPVSAAFDVACLAMVDLASIAERRVAQLVDASLSRGLPPFLAATTGLDSGFMMAQVTAAALVSESRAIATPKSVDSVPTSADREDHVSMGMSAARHFSVITENVEHVLAIEAMVALEALRLRALRPGRGVAAAADLLRTAIAPVTRDRAFHRDIQAARRLVASGSLLEAADAAAG